MGVDTINDYVQQGYFLKVNNTKAFVYEKGKGEAIICFHGVPASSYLYRKMIAELADNGYRAIAFDLIGTGLSEKPTDFNYSWTSIGEWSVELIKALKIDKFHIVIHDIGGPIGIEVIHKLPNSILSVTILNTMLYNLSSFQKPFPMNLYQYKLVGSLMLKITTPFLFYLLMKLKAVYKKDEFSLEDSRAYLKFQKWGDGGKSFLQIMKNFETTVEKEYLYFSTLKNLKVPIKIIWGENDPALNINKYGFPLQKALGVEKMITVKGKHFLQEDNYREIVTQIMNN